MPHNYRYITKDGQPPNQGTPPGVPRPCQRPQYVPTFTHPAQPAAMTSPAGPPVAPPGFCWLPAPPAAPPAPYYAAAPVPTPIPTYTPAPPPYYPPTQPCFNPAPVHGAAQPAPGVQGGTASKLPPGARVRGELPVFPNRNSGFIFGKKNCTFNIVQGRMKPWQSPGCEIEFTVAHADCRMSIKEFIEQVGASKSAPPRTPREAVGICEVIEAGNGTWRKGTQILLSDGRERLSQSLADTGWDELRGEAGLGKPVWLVLLP